MRRPVLVLLGLALSGAAACPAMMAAPAGPPLGEGHLLIEIGGMDLSSSAKDAWGVNHERYWSLKGYGGGERGFYLGGELGHSATDGTTAADGDTIRDFDFWWLEVNGKKAFALKHGLSVDAGFGGAMFYVDGREVAVMGGETVTDPLADVGFGAQVFGDFNWRVRRLLLGIDLKYQWAFDIVSVDYSNLRLGAHVGFTF